MIGFFRCHNCTLGVSLSQEQTQTLKTHVMKKVIIEFKKAVTLSEGISQMADQDTVDNKFLFTFTLEEEEVEMLIEELNEMNETYIINII